MQTKRFPVIDPVATGEKITQLRLNHGLSVRDLQAYFGFEDPQAIYKWQRGKSIPSVDNLYALGALLEVSLDEILIPVRPKLNVIVNEQQEESCCSPHFYGHIIMSPMLILIKNNYFVIELLVQSAALQVGFAPVVSPHNRIQDANHALLFIKGTPVRPIQDAYLA